MFHSYIQNSHGILTFKYEIFIWELRNGKVCEKCIIPVMPILLCERKALAVKMSEVVKPTFY